MPPGRDGVTILRQLREKNNTVPVILLTARSALNERAAGLNLGADDYLSKTFYIEELFARIHAVTRRETGHQLSMLQELRELKFLDVLLPKRKKNLRLRIAATLDKELNVLLRRMKILLPNKPKIIENVVTKMA